MKALDGSVGVGVKFANSEVFFFSNFFIICTICLNSKAFDIDMCPLPFTLEKMYNFVSNRFEDPSASVQEQVLQWLQVWSNSQSFKILFWFCILGKYLMIICLCVFINDILVSAFGFKVLLIEMWDEGDVLKQQQRDLTAEIWRFVGYGGETDGMKVLGKKSRAG